MYQFKGFCSIPGLRDNAEGKIAAIGELSTQAMTYARDCKTHSGTAVTLVEFSSKINDVSITSPTTQVATVVSILDWIQERQAMTTQPETRQVFKSLLLAQFGDKLASIEIGDMINLPTGASYPTWIAWKDLSYTQDDNSFLVWFSDDSFRQLYDEYEIVVIPPLIPIDSFFSGFSAVKAALEAKTPQDFLMSLQEEKGNYPETSITAENYPYINPTNTAQTVSTTWGFLIYGIKGNDLDLIKKAIIAYLVKNSAKPIEQWKQIFPDLFRETEFVFFPKWANIALPEISGIQSGINSPIVSLRKEISYAKKVWGAEYGDAHIDANLQAFSHPYRSLQILSLGSPNNKLAKSLITDWFPDMISVSSLSLDHNRMQEKTKAFMSHLANMLYIASTMTNYNDLGTTYKRTIRSGITFVTVSYQGIRFLVGSLATTPEA
jgi:hypothetical protein